MIKVKLNLGAGNFHKEGFINTDIDPKTNPNIVHNLEDFPYPFKNVDLIEIDHVLEHIPDPFKVMRELHRILKPGGKLVIKVPHFTRALTQPNHKRGFDVSFPYYFNKQWKGEYAGVNFKLIKMRLKWSANNHLKKRVLSPVNYYAMIFIGEIIDLLANISPHFTSRIWAYWVGGFEEIEYQFKKHKI